MKKEEINLKKEIGEKLYNSLTYKQRKFIIDTAGSISNPNNFSYSYLTNLHNNK